MKKLDTCLKLLRTDTEQYSRYTSININAVKAYKSEKDLLVKMKDFTELSTHKRDTEIENKKKLYISLDRKVQEMKSEVYEIDNVIKEKNEFLNSRKNMLKEVIRRNHVLKTELQSIK